MRPRQDGDCSASIASMVSECGDPFAGRISQEFKVIQRASAAGESREIPVPIFLVFETVTELDVCVV